MDTMNIEAKKWLKQKRKSYNLTQEQVALQLGISLTAYRDMETGKTYDYFEEVVDLINQQEIDKLNYKKELNNLKYKIKKLVGD